MPRSQTDEPGPVSDYTGQDIYYRSIQHDHGIIADRLTIARLPVAVGHRLVLVLGRRSAPSTHGYGAAGPGATGAAASTGSCWPTSTGSASSTVSRRHAGGPPENASCRTSRCRSSGARSSWTGSCPACPSSRSGCVRCGSGTAGRCTRCGPATPTSTSVSGPRCPAAPTRVRRTGGSSARSASSTGSSRCTPTPTTPRRSSTSSTACRDYRTVKQTYDPDSRLLDLYAKAVQRR